MSVPVLRYAGLLAVAVALVGAASAHAQLDGRPELKASCAEQHTNLLRYVTSTSACKSSERKVRFSATTPVFTCVVPQPVHVTAAREDQRGILKWAKSASSCGSNFELTLPGIGPRSFCVDDHTHHLRNLEGGLPCHKHGEFKVIMLGTGHPVTSQSTFTVVATADTATTNELTPIAIPVLANDQQTEAVVSSRTSRQAPALHVASVNTSGTAGAVSISADGQSVTYDPSGRFASLKAGQTATDTFAYTASNGTSSSSAQVTVTILGVNEPPVANADSATTDKLTPIPVAVLGNDTDADGDALTVASVDTTGTKGKVTINPDGTITYDPNGQFASLTPSQTATDRFTYVVSDGTTTSLPATVTVTVTGFDQPPVLSGIEAGALAVGTGTTTNVTASLTASDPDTATLSSANVSVSAGYVMGDDVLSFTAPGGSGITGVFDGLSGTLALSGTATLAQYTAALQSVTYTTTAPTPSGTRTIAFSVNDGIKSSNTATRGISLTHVNHPPNGVADAATVTKDATVDIPVLANDSDLDADPLTVASVDTTGTKGAVSINPDGTIHYDPNGQFDALTPLQSMTDTFTYEVTDGTVTSAPVTVTVTVKGANTAPVLSNIEGSALAVNSGDTDPVTSTLTVSDADSTMMTGATVSIGTGFVAADDTLDCVTLANITCSYNASTGVLTLTGSDTIANYQSELRSVTYSSADEASGSRTITFQITDDGGLPSNPESRTVTVTHVNHNPSAINHSATVDEDGTVTINLLTGATDPDGDTVSVATVNQPGASGATVTDNGDGTVTYDPNGKFEDLNVGGSRPDSFTYTVSDGNGGTSAPATVNVTVTGSDDAPVLAGETETPALAYNTGETDPIAPNITVSDVDDTNLSSATVTVSSGFAAGSDSLACTSTATITCTPDASTGVLTLTGSDTLADYQAELRTVTFHDPSLTPSGARTISFTVNDGSLDSTPLLKDITVTQFNNPPVANPDSYSTAIPNTDFVVGPTDTDAAPSDLDTAAGVLANDTDLELGEPGVSEMLTATAQTIATTKGGSVDMNTDGTFTYHPPPGFTGNDTFQYTLNDNNTTFGGNKTALGTVTITVGGTIPWYVDNTQATDGNGDSNSPFNKLSDVEPAAATDKDLGVNDDVFLYSSATPYTGGIVLESGQNLLGQPDGLKIGSDQLVAPGAGANPAITNSGGDGIDLASGVDVEDVNVTSASGAGVAGTDIATATVGSGTSIGGATGGAVALSGAASGNITIDSTITNSSGPAISVSGRGTGTVDFGGAVTDTGSGISLSANGTAAIQFDGALSETTGSHTALATSGGGTVTASNASNQFTTTSGNGLDVGSGGGDVTVDAAITTTGGSSLHVNGHATGTTVKLSGSVTDSGSGVSLTGNTGVTIDIPATLSLSTGTSNAFTATGGGTVDATATSSGNPVDTATTTTGTAIDIANTTIGAGGVLFKSVSAGTSAPSGPTDGIILNTTGSSGSFVDAGTGDTTTLGGDASGGTIQHTGGAAVSLTSTKSPSFHDLTITAPHNAGVRGTQVSGFSYTNGTITGAGEGAGLTTAPLDAALAFNGTANTDNVDGAVTITDDKLTDGFGGGVEVSNTSGTISDADIADNTIANTTSDDVDADGIELDELGTATTVASVTQGELNGNTLTGVRDYGINVNAGNVVNANANGGAVGTYGTFGSNPDSPTKAIQIESNSITGNAASKMNGFGISAGITGEGTGAFQILNNSPVTNMVGEGIGTGVAGSAQADFEVTGNTVTPNNSLNNTGISLGVDKNTQAGGAVLDSAATDADISSNTISATNGQGIWVLARDSHSTTKVKLDNNTIGDPSSTGGFGGLEIDDGSSGLENAVVCADISQPTQTIGTGPANGFGSQEPGIVLAQGGGTGDTTDTFGLNGALAANVSSVQNAANFIQGNNPHSATGNDATYGTAPGVDVGNIHAFTTCTLGF